MQKSLIAGMVVLLAVGGCSDQGRSDPGRDQAKAQSASSGADLSLVRLDCGSATFEDMNKFFSDRPGVYPPGSGTVTDSCYLIRHGDQQMLWDTGLPASAKAAPLKEQGMTARVQRTLAEQLADLGLKPTDIDVVGISHGHFDHVGQAAEFGHARLVIGKGDFDKKPESEDPLAPWRGTTEEVVVDARDSDIDVFGDGSVVALFLPGHTPGHHALLVNLKSGPVLLSGDLYHSTIAREKRAVPGFNSDRKQTLASMDTFEALAKRLKAKVIIQHEPADIGKLPAFPKAAE